MALALIVTLLAGLSTCVGGWLGTRPLTLRPGVLASSLALAAGLMISISVVEIAPASVAALAADGSPGAALAWVLGTMALGAGVVYLLCLRMPHHIDPSQIGGGGELRRVRSGELDLHLLRSGLLLAAVVGLHNLPEGLATFLTTLREPSGGLVLALAIAIHNVPEGVAVAAPIYAATGSRRRALWWATLSGLAEPVGALLGYAVLRLLLPGDWIDLSLALVAGMMIAVSFLELLPAARRYQARPAEPLVGFLLGAVLMVLSLALLTLA